MNKYTAEQIIGLIQAGAHVIVDGSAMTQPQLVALAQAAAGNAAGATVTITAHNFTVEQLKQIAMVGKGRVHVSVITA
jgi:hypothetical protein